MAVCRQCGRKLFFGHLNSDHLCRKCVEKNEAERKAMLEAEREAAYIEEISMDRDHSEEESACSFFVDEFVKLGKNAGKFRLLQKTQEYTSMTYGMTEILRIRMTERVKWIAIRMDAESAERFKDDPVFEWQTDKTQKFWKSYFKSLTDLFRYAEIVTEIPLVDYYGIGRELSEDERAAADYLFDLFVQCGADPENFYMYELANAFELMYGSLGGRVRVRMDAENGIGTIVDSELGGSGKYVFETLAELDELTASYIPVKVANGAEMEMDMHRYRKFDRN